MPNAEAYHLMFALLSCSALVGYGWSRLCSPTPRGSGYLRGHVVPVCERPETPDLLAEPPASVIGTRREAFGFGRPRCGTQRLDPGRVLKRMVRAPHGRWCNEDLHRGARSWRRWNKVANRFMPARWEAPPCCIPGQLLSWAVGGAPAPFVEKAGKPRLLGSRLDLAVGVSQDCLHRSSQMS
jgi:hypothetical protein